MLFEYRRWVMGGEPTCWVIDHPAHAQLFSRFIKEGSPVDIIVATRRKEIDAMMANDNSPLPKRQTITVQRPVGRKILPIQREIRALRRLLKVSSVLKRRNLTGKPIEKIVVKGAALELRAAKRAKIRRRIYITDTEVNHLAHRIALSAATEVILTPNWRVDLDGGFLESCTERGITVHHLEGELPHTYLTLPSMVRPVQGGGAGNNLDQPSASQPSASQPSASQPSAGGSSVGGASAGAGGVSASQSNTGGVSVGGSSAGGVRASESGSPTGGGIPKIVHRALVGGGVHDKGERVAAAALIPDLGMGVTTVAENHPIHDPWGLPSALSEFDGALSESVTLAHEAVLSGVPTLLVSKAQRGFLDSHLGGGLLFRIDSTVKGPALNNEVAAWREAVQMRRRGDGLAVSWSAVTEELLRILR